MVRSWNVRYLSLEAAVLLFFVTVAVIRFYNILTGKESFVLPMDTSDLIYPDYYFFADSLKSGHFPLWNSHQFSGMPVAGYPQYGVFYPGNLLFWLLPYGSNPFPYQAYEFNVIFHVMLAGWFMYFLGKGLGMARHIAILMGVIYMLSSNLMKFIVWGNALPAFTWFPLVLLFTILLIKQDTQKITYAIVGSLCLGMVILASPAQPAIMILILIGVLSLYMILTNIKNIPYVKSTVIHIAVFVMSGILIGSISLLPILEFTSHSIRFLGPDGTLIGNEKMSIQAFTHYTISVKNLFGFIFPAYSHTEVGNTFIGMIPFGLAVVGAIYCFKSNRLVQAMVVFVAISIVYALGWVLPYVFYYVPFLNKIREPQRYLIYLNLLVPVLAGYGLSYLLALKKEKIFKANKKLSGVLLGIVTLIAGSIIMMQYNIIQDISKGLLYGVFAGAIVVLACLYFNNRTAVAYLNVILIVIVLFELLGNPIISYDRKAADIDEYLSGMSKLEKLKPETKNEPFRVHAIESTRWPIPYNAGEIVGFQDTFGYGNPILNDVFQYRTRVNFNSKFYDMLNVKYFVAYDESVQRIDPLLTEDLRKDFTISELYGPPYDQKNQNTLTVYQNENRLGNAWIVDKVTRLAENEDYVIRIETTDFDPFKEVLVDDKTFRVNYQQSDTPLQYDLSTTEYEDKKLAFTANVSKPSLLILSELYYPGWKAYVNGKEQEIFKANGIFRGVYLEEGQNKVEFVYKPSSVLWGALLLIVTLLLMALYAIGTKFRNIRSLQFIYVGITSILFILFLILGLLYS